MRAQLRPTAQDLKSFGIDFIDRELIFVTEHPEFKGLTPALRGTYLTCQGKDMPDNSVELDEVYSHYRGCVWCQDHFSAVSEDTRELLDGWKEESEG